ncbi:MAG: ThuA domain-containing protein [Candidatus Solibacter usitatus]|nr:ThuA domain-containing protein [Candidatus Solibacter usitatus]
MLHRLLLALVCCAALAAAQDKVRVLIITGQTDLPYHDWRISTLFLHAELDKTGRFDVKVTEEPRALSAAALNGYNVLLLNYNGPRLGAAAEQAIENFVRRGGGFVAFHGVSYGQFFGQVQDKSMRWTTPAGPSTAWTAYAELVGSTWKPENIGHGARHVFPVTWSDSAHPIARGQGTSFLANDELYHRLDLTPGAHVVATAFSAKETGGTGKHEPILWTTSFGQGRGVHFTLGHDLSSMAQPGFLTALARSLEWAATGDVLPAAKAPEPRVRVLTVTGGHGFPTEFFSLFAGDPLLDWRHAGSQAEAFSGRLAGRYDVIVFHDMAESLGEKEQANLQAFVEAGGGIVSTHHAIVNYTSWPWWYQEVIGGKYFVNPLPGHPKSEYKEGVDFVATAAKGRTGHPVLRGVPPLPVHDEVYKGMWHSEKITVLMETAHPLNDPPVVYIGPHPKARSVYIQLGHSASTLTYPGYRRLVHNAILWTAGKLQ